MSTVALRSPVMDVGDVSPTAVGPAADETVAMPELPTGMQEPLAWSNADPADVVLSRPWRVAIRVALTLLALSVAAAGGIALIGIARRDDAPAPPAARPEQPSASPSPPPAVPTPAPSPDPPKSDIATATSVVAQPEIPPSPPAPDTSAIDDVFLNQLTIQGMTITNRANAIITAHNVCRMLSKGDTDADLVPIVMHDNPGLTSISDTEAVITAAAATYCPQYSHQLGRY